MTRACTSAVWLGAAVIFSASVVAGCGKRKIATDPVDRVIAYSNSGVDLEEEVKKLSVSRDETDRCVAAAIIYVYTLSVSPTTAAEVLNRLMRDPSAKVRADAAFAQEKVSQLPREIRSKKR